VAEKVDEEEVELVESIKALKSGKEVSTTLHTDERVLARVTDGIYRQPGSAIRELIANSYDADATIVSVSTDAPRFDSIRVSDDGSGMSAEVLANLIRHIGGSAKRTSRAQDMEMSDPDNPTLSRYKRRRLIGKIGIGLFSVSQLTRQFTIVTKRAGTRERLVADVTLHRFNEEILKDKPKDGKPFETGKVTIWKEKTPDEKGHGTTIALTQLIPRVVQLLQSRDEWRALAEADQTARQRRKEPAFHIGQVADKEPTKLVRQPKLPWSDDTPEGLRYAMLVEGVVHAAEKEDLFSQLDFALDSYFRMLWTLGIALPLPYVKLRPSQLTGADLHKVYKLSEKIREGQADEVKLKPEETVGEKLGVPVDSTPEDFSVVVDGTKIFRPVMYSGFPKTKRALQRPVIFAGRYHPNMKKADANQSGGELAFSGYFFWTPRVVPRDHTGILVRINGASGTGFDSTFLKYQVAENRRLRQIIAEVFIEEGLDSALNIDRESFNTAHPHYQLLVSWVHNALRQAANKLKAVEKDERDKKRDREGKKAKADWDVLVDTQIEIALDGDEEAARDVVIAEDEAQATQAEAEGALVLPKAEVINKTDAAKPEKEAKAVKMAEAVTKLLDAYGLLESLSRDDQIALVAGIVRLAVNA